MIFVLVRRHVTFEVRLLQGVDRQSRTGPRITLLNAPNNSHPSQTFVNKSTEFPASWFSTTTKRQTDYIECSRRLLSRRSLYRLRRPDTVCSAQRSA